MKRREFNQQAISLAAVAVVAVAGAPANAQDLAKEAQLSDLRRKRRAELAKRRQEREAARRRQREARTQERLAKVDAHEAQMDRDEEQQTQEHDAKADADRRVSMEQYDKRSTERRSKRSSLREQQRRARESREAEHCAKHSAAEAKEADAERTAMDRDDEDELRADEQAVKTLFPGEQAAKSPSLPGSPPKVVPPKTGSLLDQQFADDFAAKRFAALRQLARRS
jgi:hypothetical protein